jgi:glycosyltransferase involved in cell wall biosynthesis
MKILSFVHAYPPIHNCGAEWMLHEINKFFISQGHEVKVLIEGTKEYDFEGVPVRDGKEWADSFSWCDCVITHLDKTTKTLDYGKYRPIIWLMHNTHNYGMLRGMKNVHVIYNSNAAKVVCEYPFNDSFVLRPPTDIGHYDVNKDAEKNEFITLINLNDNKGANQFHEIAKLMPEKKFLGVKGSYEEQILSDLPNVTIIENTSDIREVYKKTRLLLMPSKYESWGRTATEAMANGIPVIANKTFGLEENLSDAGLFCERENINEWIDMIKKLDTKKEYDKQSKKVRARAKQLDSAHSLQEFEKYLHKVTNTVHVSKKEYANN